MKTLFELFITFAKLGVMTFGGGYAMLPLLERIIVKEKGWATYEEMMDYYAIGQCTPGVIAVSTATFIGIKKKGAAGGIAATLGIIFPSFIIISIIAHFMKQFAEIEAVRHAFIGIRIAVCALVTATVFSLAKKAAIDAAALIIFILVFAAGAVFGWQPMILVLLAGISGVVIKSIKRRMRRD